MSVKSKKSLPVTDNKFLSDLETLPIYQVLKSNNITIEDLMKCGKEGLIATRSIKDKYGDVVEVEPDHNVRHKYFDSMLNMLQILKPASVNVQMVNISAEEKELLDSYKVDRME